MKKSLIVFLILIFILPGLFIFGSGAEEKKEKKPGNDIAPFVGHWRMVKMTGKEAGDYIAHMEFFFKADATFKAIATLRDGATDKKEGTFAIEKNRLKMTVGEKQVTPTFEFKDSYLIIHDDQFDSQIWLKKAPDKPGKTKKKTK